MTENDVEGAVRNLAKAARQAQKALATMTTRSKDDLIYDIAQALKKHADDIAEANAVDMQMAREEGMSEGLLDRLRFDVQRVHATVGGLLDIKELADPVGRVVRGHHMPNGLRLEQTRVPIGVVGMIYEARPNVTIDVIGLCLKSGNAVIVRGGHAAEHTNAQTLRVVRDVLVEHGLEPDLISSIDTFGREGVAALLNARGDVDVIVPRGSAALIEYVAQNSRVPIIETGAGNVHIYIDQHPDFDIIEPIVVNAKTQRVGVCNAAEKLLIHSEVASQVVPRIVKALAKHHVIMHCDAQTLDCLERVDESAITDYVDLVVPATDEDWDTEYLDYAIGIKIVHDIDEAIAHINLHSTHHTDAIISHDYNAIEKFTQEVDSATIMVNASTRFTDGGQFGFGAELGISTQKLHARGPMGLEELTTTRWVGYGTGQVRD